MQSVIAGVPLAQETKMLVVLLSPAQKVPVDVHWNDFVLSFHVRVAEMVAAEERSNEASVKVFMIAEVGRV